MCKMYRKLSQWVDAEKRVSDIVSNEHVPATTRGDVFVLYHLVSDKIFISSWEKFVRSLLHTYIYIHRCTCMCETCFCSRFVSPPFLFTRRVGVKGFARPCLSLVCTYGYCAREILIGPRHLFVTGGQIIRPRLAYAAYRCRYGTIQQYRESNVAPFLAVDLSKDVCIKMHVRIDTCMHVSVSVKG